MSDRQAGLLHLPAMTGKKKPGNRPNPRKKGLEKVMFRLEPEQLQALRREAIKLAAKRGSMKPDASELVREALAAWLRRR